MSVLCVSVMADRSSPLAVVDARVAITSAASRRNHERVGLTELVALKEHGEITTFCANASHL